MNYFMGKHLLMLFGNKYKSLIDDLLVKFTGDNESASRRYFSMLLIFYIILKMIYKKEMEIYYLNF